MIYSFLSKNHIFLIFSLEKQGVALYSDLHGTSGPVILFK
jgi:hypothetical protein